MTKMGDELSDVIRSVPEALEAAAWRAWFWARRERARQIEAALPSGWFAGWPGEVHRGEDAVCFGHPRRLATLARVVCGEELTEQDEEYLCHAYGLDWATLLPELIDED